MISTKLTAFGDFDAKSNLPLFAPHFSTILIIVLLIDVVAVNTKITPSMKAFWRYQLRTYVFWIYPVVLSLCVGAVVESVSYFLATFTRMWFEFPNNIRGLVQVWRPSGATLCVLVLVDASSSQKWSERTGNKEIYLTKKNYIGEDRFLTQERWLDRTTIATNFPSWRISQPANGSLTWVIPYSSQVRRFVSFHYFMN